MKYIVSLLCLFLLSACSSSELKEVNFSEREAVLFEEYVIPFSFFPRKIELVGLGDSLTQGVGDELQGAGYIGRLQKEISQYKGIEEVVLTNTAKRGRRSDQLLKMLKAGDIDHQLRKANIITLTIGGNDMMKVVKKDLFDLRVEAFEKELVKFEKNYDQILEEIREINSSAPIILLGLYNPITAVTDEKSELDEILADWNKSIETIAYSDVNACFVPIDQLFVTNANLVYHTDFFHPNSRGYELIGEALVHSLEDCGLIDERNREMLF